MCTPVKQYVQKQRMAMQKQQQESLRLREAERHRYGEARMQVCCLLYHQLLLLPTLCHSYMSANPILMGRGQCLLKTVEP